MRILVVFGTRPEAIKLFPVIHELKKNPQFHVKVCVTAQHREMLDQVLAIADIAPDYDLNLMKENQNLTDLTAQIIARVGGVIDDCSPDRVIVQGDTTTAMASALSAFYRKIPVDHVEAGLRSGSVSAPWPEELNRRIVGSIASLHFAPTQRAADALIGERIPKNRVFVTGNTVIDALLKTQSRIEKFSWVHDAVDGALTEVRNKRIILVTTHRRENFNKGIDRILSALTAIAERDDCVIFFPVHPNPNIKNPVFLKFANHPNINLLPPLEYIPFVRILSRCYFVLTDSGGIQEEAPVFGKPVLIMRDTTERPEGIDAGTAILVGTEPSRIIREATHLLESTDHYNRMKLAHNPFGDGTASLQIANILRTEERLLQAPKFEELRHAS